MRLQSVDLTHALRRVADQRIEEAMREGKFDNLRGMGQPLELDPMPADENARMTWWCLRIMKQNDFTPEEVVWRKSLDRLHENLDRADDENRIHEWVGKINDLVYRLNTLGTNALKSPIAPVDLDECLEEFRRRERARGGT
jgi:hypothetical protein